MMGHGGLEPGAAQGPGTNGAEDEGPGTRDDQGPVNQTERMMMVMMMTLVMV